MAIRKPDITRFLRDYAAALSSGDLKSVAAAWHLPALVVDRRGTVLVTRSKQVEAFFAQAIAAYRAAGTPTVRLESAEVVKVSSGLVHVTATWRGVRDNGRLARTEKSFYVISRQGTPGRLGFDLATSFGDG